MALEENALSTPDRLTRIFEFLETVDRLKVVYRAACVADNSRHENSAEHSWHACLYALLLHQECATPVRLERVFELLLAHDLVEVYAGDTPAYDAGAAADQHARELAAADRLFAGLPEDLGGRVRAAWDEFEAGETAESRFAHAVDRLQGMAQNIFAGGGSWRERGVTKAMTAVRAQPALTFDPATAAMVDLIWARADRQALWTTPAPGPAEA